LPADHPIERDRAGLDDHEIERTQGVATRAHVGAARWHELTENRELQQEKTP
jgi:hypothetical protein